MQPNRKSQPPRAPRVPPPPPRNQPSGPPPPPRNQPSGPPPPPPLHPGGQPPRLQERFQQPRTSQLLDQPRRTGLVPLNKQLFDAQRRSLPQSQPQRGWMPQIAQGFEEQLVANFFHRAGGTRKEMTMYKYIVKFSATDWADGEIFSYCFWKKMWKHSGTKVKFYIIPVSDEESKNKIYSLVDNMIAMRGYMNTLTPIFAVDDKKENRMLICYPYFDYCVKDWTPNNMFQGHTLPLPWKNLIRDALSCMPIVEKMGIANFGGMESYVWVQNTTSLKIILFPKVENEKKGLNHCLAEFGRFLGKYIAPKCGSIELTSFIDKINDDPKMEILGAHPLIQDDESLLYLIRMTWRPKISSHGISKAPLSESQLSALNVAIDAVMGSTSWKALSITDPVLQYMLSIKKTYTDDAAGLFMFIKEVAAHYPEKYKQYCKTIVTQHPPRLHPIAAIRENYPAVLVAIYNLSLDPEWLMKSK